MSPLRFLRTSSVVSFGHLVRAPAMVSATVQFEALHPSHCGFSWSGCWQFCFSSSSGRADSSQSLCTAVNHSALLSAVNHSALLSGKETIAQLEFVPTWTATTPKSSSNGYQGIQMLQGIN